MKARHSTAWKGSTQIRKQRKYRHNAPLHTLGKFLHAHLIKDLRVKYGIRSIRVRVGDKVRVMRGQFAGKEGKVEGVRLKESKLIINKVELTKQDGNTKVPYPTAASNVAIVELDLTDKRRASEFKARADAAGKKAK